MENQIDDWEDVPVDGINDWEDVPFEPSKLESAARGAAQGATFGFMDEIVGAGKGLYDDMKSVFTGENVSEIVPEYDRNGRVTNSKQLTGTYEKHRDEYRDADKKAEAANPGSYLAGDLGGSVATSFIPGLNALNVGKGAKISEAALKAGAGGLASGIGRSDAENMSDQLKDAATAAGTGAVFGAGTRGLMSAKSKIMSDEVADYLSRKAEKLAENATGATAVQSNKFSDKAGRELLDRGIVTFGSTPEKVAQRTLAAKDKAGQAIGEALDAADAKGASVSRDSILESISAKINELSEDPSNAAIVKKLSKMSDDIAKSPKNTLSLKEAESIKRGFQSQSNYAKPNTTRASKEVASTYRKAVEDAATKVDPELAQKFIKEKEDFKLFAPILEASNRRAAQLKQSPIGGFLDTTASLAGELAGGPLTGIPAAVARRTLAPRLASSGAVTADKISKMLKENPDAFGPYLGILENAANRGQAAFMSTFNLLQKKDPDFQKILEGN